MATLGSQLGGQRADIIANTSGRAAQLQSGRGTALGNATLGQGSQQAQLAQNLGNAQAGANAFRAQQTPALVQGMQAGLSAFGGLGGFNRQQNQQLMGGIQDPNRFAGVS